jgi:16S rRNA G966 N2-methylase RsmD
MIRLIKKTILTIRTEGPVTAFQRIRHFLSERYHEKRLGITTSGFVKIPDIHNNVTCFGYEPVDYKSFIRIFNRLHICEDRDVFIDFGSGMGRAVILAAMYPFRRVIGVEISPELNTIAEQNIQRARKKLKCKDIQLITADAHLYNLSADVTVVYFFSPFGEEIISRVVENVRRSLCENPRKMTFIFVNPRIFENVIAKQSWLIKSFEFRRWDNLKYVIYETREDMPDSSRTGNSSFNMILLIWLLVGSAN